MAGIFPFDRDIFSHLEFLPSDVTDRLVCSAGTDNLTQSKHQQLLNEWPQVLERPSSSIMTRPCVMSLCLLFHVVVFFKLHLYLNIY